MVARTAAARWTGALALLLVLVLQVVLSSLALGHAGDRPTLDAFGHELCLGSGAQDDGGSDPHDHGKLPDCCTFACSMFWPQLPARDGDVAARTPAVAAVEPPPAPVRAIASSFLDHRRRHPRAPPMTV